MWDTIEHYMDFITTTNLAKEKYPYKKLHPTTLGTDAEIRMRLNDILNKAMDVEIQAWHYIDQQEKHNIQPNEDDFIKKYQKRREAFDELGIPLKRTQQPVTNRNQK